MKRLFSTWALLLGLLLVGSCSKSDDYPEEPAPKPTPDGEQTELTIQITEPDTLLRFSDNETKTIHYAITGDTANLEVKAEMQNDDGGYVLQITPTSKTAGTVEIQAKTPTENRVIISASDGRQTVQTSIAVSADSLLGDQTELVVQITEQDTLLRFSDNETKTIHYTITGDTADLVVKAELQNDDNAYTLQITPTSKTAGTVEIQAKLPTTNRVIVSVSDGRQTVQTSIAVAALPFDGLTIHVETPGTLGKLLADRDLSTLTELRVTGSINDEDMATLNALPNLSVLDIENTDLGKLPYRAFYDNKTLTSVKLPQALTTIGEYAFSGCSGLTGNLTIPNGVTTIGSSAFGDCSGLTGITIPNSVTTIGAYAFSGCSGLTGDLTILDGVTTIKNGIFYGCSGLTGTLTIPNSVTTIGGFAFYGCSGLTGALTIPNSVTTIGENAFSDCSGLTGNLTIPNGVTTIEGGAFRGCSGLTSITIPNSVTTIGGSAFSGCSGLTGTLTIPESVTTIGGGAFSDCTGLTSVTIPNGVTEIGNGAFKGCSGLTSITIPNGVTTIGNTAFSDCSGLTSVTIPNSVTTIETFAFANCSGLTQIECKSNTPPQLGSRVFTNGSTRNCVLYVPTGCAEAYRTAEGWKDYTFKEIIETDF